MADVQASVVEQRITTFIQDELGIPADEIESDVNLGSYGLSSSAAVKLIGLLEDQFKLKLSPTMVFDHPTVSALSNAIASAGAVQRVA